jgi:hypothetical protein
MPRDLTARAELTVATCALYVRVPRGVRQQDAVAVAAACWTLPNCGVSVSGEGVDALLAELSLKVWREKVVRILHPVPGSALAEAIVWLDTADVQSPYSSQLCLDMRAQAIKADTTLLMLKLWCHVLKTTSRDWDVPLERAAILWILMHVLEDGFFFKLSVVVLILGGSILDLSCCVL